jgi:hypothetical protein
MRTTIKLLLAAALAVPSVASADELRAESQRVWYHGTQATIAARDLMTARAEMTLAGNDYDKAVYRDHDAKKAEAAARRYREAARDAREAKLRLDTQTEALMRARESFQQIARIERGRKIG